MGYGQIPIKNAYDAAGALFTTHLEYCFGCIALHVVPIDDYLNDTIPDLQPSTQNLITISTSCQIVLQM